MDALIPAALAKCMKALAPDVKKATLYLGEKLVVSICRRRKYSKRSTREDMTVKVGAPNYLERAFIKRCKKAGEPIPIKRVQIKAWPAKRAS